MIRVGLVGAGYGCRVLLPAFRGTAGCSVVGLAGSTAGRAAVAASDAGLTAFESWTALVTCPDIDAVVIAVPPVAQPGIIEAAARAGKHVFCEKPVAATLDDAERAAAEVKRCRVVSAVDFLFPESEPWQRARRILADGTIGTPRRFSYAWRTETRAVRAGAPSWKLDEQQGGGALANFGSHALYAIEWLLGPVSGVGPFDRGSALRHGRVACGTLELVSGVRGALSIETDRAGENSHVITIDGDLATLELANRTADLVDGFEVTVSSQRATRPDVRSWTGEDGRIAAARSIASRFVRAIADGGVVTPNLQDGLRVQELLEAARTGRPLRSAS